MLSSALRLALVTVVVVGCQTPKKEQPRKQRARERVTSPDIKEVGGAVVHLEGGRVKGSISESHATALGLTVIRLSDDWTPYLFSEVEGLQEEIRHQPYRDTYLRLADERWAKGPEWDRAKADRFLELYGIFPTFRVLRQRIEDEDRHRCHEGVDDTWLQDMKATLHPWADPEAQRRKVWARDRFFRILEGVRKRRGLTHVKELERDRRYGPVFRKYLLYERELGAVAAVQSHLRCEKLLSRHAENGIFDIWTGVALRTYQRRHMIVSWGVLDAETRETMLTSSRELDFRAILRALRERVADAAGLIEDGSALSKRGDVLGRTLDSQDFRGTDDLAPLAGGAPDLISPATDAAARALGWVSPHHVRSWFAQFGTGGEILWKQVAVRLPPMPDYHARHMDLRAEIDRGDVWYDYPFTSTAKKKSQPIRRRPTLVLYVRHRGQEIPLIRFRTTIGGWKPERLGSGLVRLRYKNSEVGVRLWRDLVASPAWLPPESTPDEDLVRREPGHDWAVNEGLFGPGYRSAYGLAMLVHHLVLPSKDGKELTYWDRGIRTHGSVSYHSILGGQSHGCHRVFNHLAVRLTGFLLQHRNHARRGQLLARYVRNFAWRGRAMSLRIRSRGYLYELTPPIEVRVLPGTIRGRQKQPLQVSRPLPEDLVRSLDVEDE